MTIDEFYEEHEGIEYSVDADETVEVPEGQLSLDENEEDETKLQRVK
ncbi:hypothetical protein J2S17_001998 [Cytobacillus purgationiresistens]|uniref:DUF4025 domain-containing protein n=1 Tax=Cytobacillus purgationiresistens TaxID=863449 RepID=A0ABU0AI57_9BACI|nr:hypothetical protein [Cytobacillus purgationiresistens]